MDEQYYRVEARIHQEAVRSNIRTIREALSPGVRIMAVVKADAYGHGFANIWPVLEEEKVGYLAVAVVEEGLRIRRMGITAPVLLLGYTAPEEAETLIDNELTATVFTYKMAKALSDAAVRKNKKTAVHIALETGMNRIGFACTEESVRVIKRISALPGLVLEGLFTHYFWADQRDKTCAKNQLARFIWMDRRLREEGVEIPLRHTANSAAIMEMPETQFEMVRAGIILYGLSPSEAMDTNRFPLRPVMELRSHVIYIKEIEDGATVGYGAAYRARGRRRIGTVPVGYADGYPRLLSNQGEVLIRGRRARVAGRICMDQFMIDLTDVPEAREGDEVILFGEGLPLDELAEKAGTISYELACGVSARVPRKSCV